MNKLILIFSAIIFSLLLWMCTQEPTGTQQDTIANNAEVTGQRSFAKASSGDPEVLAMMENINEQLAARGLNIAVEAIEFFTIGQGRPSNRIHQQPFRWVPGDPRRNAQGNDITYIVDQSFQGTTSGVSATDTEDAIDRSMETWDGAKALRKVSIVKRDDPDFDISIFDEFFPGTNPDEPEPGDPVQADIVNVGWYPLTYFDAVVGGGPGSGCGVLAFSVTFIFGSFDADGNFIPSDINGDNYLDTAFNEVYYNDDFGDPNSPCQAGIPNDTQPWGINIALPGVDVETVALHENGHSLGIGHFGPPPAAVLNPVYAGIRQSPMAPDHAGMSAVWTSWPNP